VSCYVVVFFTEKLRNVLTSVLLTSDMASYARSHRHV